MNIFLFPKRIGNVFHGFCVACLWLFLPLLAADVILYGVLWLTGNLEAFMRAMG